VPSLTIETPEPLIERLESAVWEDWETSGRLLGQPLDPFDDADETGWCVVRSPGCHVSVSREPFMLWLNPLETRLLEWPRERRTRPRPSASRLIEMTPGATEDLLAIAARRLGVAGNPTAQAHAWLRDVDWNLALVDPETGAMAQGLIDAWSTQGSAEERLDMEVEEALAVETRQWIEGARAQALLLRLMLMPSVAADAVVRTSARGTLERLESLREEVLGASAPDHRRNPEFANRLCDALGVWLALMDRCARTLVIPGGQHPFPTSASGRVIDLRFHFPPRLLWLWIKRARRIAEALLAGRMASHMEIDLISVEPDALDDCRLNMMADVVILAAVMLQYNQGPPDLQEEVAAVAEEILPALEQPSRVGLRPIDRGPRAARMRALLPRALSMGREIAQRHLSLALGNSQQLMILRTAHNGPLHHCFPFKLGPEQPLPYAHLLVAESFSQVAPIFAP
jgi:hypothetical protein